MSGKGEQEKVFTNGCEAFLKVGSLNIIFLLMPEHLQNFSQP